MTDLHPHASWRPVKPPCQCCSTIWRNGQPPDPPPAVVRWHCQPSGNLVYLCQSCLDSWLDNADDDPELEPANVVWLEPIVGRA